MRNRGRLSICSSCLSLFRIHYEQYNCSPIMYGNMHMKCGRLWIIVQSLAPRADLNSRGSAYGWLSVLRHSFKQYIVQRQTALSSSSTFDSNFIEPSTKKIVREKNCRKPDASRYNWRRRPRVTWPSIFFDLHVRQLETISPAAWHEVIGAPAASLQKCQNTFSIAILL